MAWTSPMTFVANSVITASQLNTHLRDNLMETMPARASIAGQYFVTDAKNRVVARRAAKHTILTSETTTSTDYTDLDTVGPFVTLETGSSVMIYFGCQMSIASASQAAYMSVEIAPADDDTGGDDAASSEENQQQGGQGGIEPGDSYALCLNGAAASDGIQASHHILHIGSVTPGLNTVTAKYRSSIDSSAATFLRRRISVMSVT